MGKGNLSSKSVSPTVGEIEMRITLLMHSEQAEAAPSLTTSSAQKPASYQGNGKTFRGILGGRQMFKRV